MWAGLGQTKAQADEIAYTIQIASYKDAEYEDFKKIHKIGYLYEQTAPNGLTRLMMGVYSSSSLATSALAKVKAQGYKDAFLQKMPIDEKDAVYIVQLATMDWDAPVVWSDWQKMAGSKFVAQLSDEKLRLAVGGFKTEEEAEAVFQKLRPQAPRDMFVKKVSAKVLHKITPFEMSASPQNMNLSKGQARVSVRNLQQLLAKEGQYKLPADGFWGKGVEIGLKQYQNTNEKYQNYQLIAEKAALAPKIEQFSLQYYINIIGEKPFTADEGLKQFKHPLAKAYRAYLFLHGDVQTPDMQEVVDKLMNDACKQVFANYKLKTRSDFRMSYSYKHTEQLLQHLRELHEAVKDEPDFPCWMFQRHPELCEQIFAPYWNSERDNFSISSDCGSFLALPQVKTLVAISKDFSANPQVALAQPKFAQISHLYVLAEPLSREEMDKLEGWNTQLWTNLSKSVAGNTILQKNYQLLQIAYQDALRTIEDFYIKKGFVYTDARALGLQVLQHTVGGYLE